MKQPRVEDFDPNSPPTLSSPLDGLPAIESASKADQPLPDFPLQAAPRAESPSPEARTDEPTNERITVAPNVPSLVVLNEPTNVRTKERSKVRHTFDILSGQLLALREICVEREKVFGKRVLLGDLAQEALDMFITKERNNEGTND